MDFGWEILFARVGRRLVEESIDGFTALACCSGIACLDHKVTLDIMKTTKVVVFDLTQLEKVEARLWRFFRVKVDNYVADGGFDQNTHTGDRFDVVVDAALMNPCRPYVALPFALLANVGFPLLKVVGKKLTDELRSVPSSASLKCIGEKKGKWLATPLDFFSLSIPVTTMIDRRTKLR